MTLFSKKGWQCGLWRRKRPYGPLVLTVICLGLLGCAVAAAQDIFSVTKEGRITANIVDVPLGQALAALSRNVPLEVKGSFAENERLSLHFSQLTLREALQEIMANYNYVLIRPEGNAKSILVVLGKVEKAKATVPPPAAGLPSSPAKTAQPRSATLQPSPPIAPAPSGVPEPPSFGQTAPVPSSPATESAPAPVPPPPMPAPLSAGPASEGQAAAGQGNLPPPTNVEGPAGQAPNPDSQPPFNPGAWGGRGFGGSAASGRK